MIRTYFRTHRVGLLLAVVTLIVACFKPQAALAAPFIFGTLMTEDDLIRKLIALGFCDSNGLFQHGFRDECENITADRTLTIADSGKTFYVRAIDKVVTLPAAAAATLGMTVTFIITNAALSSGTGFSISPNASDFIVGTGLTQVDNKDLINTGGTDDEGDSVTLKCDGVDGWYLIEKQGTWAKE
jgi:hypothetical protein